MATKPTFTPAANPWAALAADRKQRKKTAGKSTKGKKPVKGKGNGGFGS